MRDLSARATPKATLVCATAARRDAVGGYVVFLARSLRELGFEVRILAEEALDLPLDLASLGRVVGACRRANDLPQDLADHLARSQVSVFVYAADYELLGLLEGRVGGLRVFDYHGVTPPGLWRGPGAARLAASEAGVSVAAACDLAIAHSSWMVDELCRRAGLPADRIVRLPLPVDVERFRVPADEATRATPGLDRTNGPASAALLYVGRIASAKRVDVLISALALLVARGREARLTLVGDAELAPYRATLERLLARARRLGVADRVVVAGRLPDAELPAAYAASDVVVTASEHEGFCVPLVEAMASGRPVVATATTAIPETLGDAGLLVPPGDPAAFAAAVQRVLDDPRLRDRLVAAGRQRVAGLTPARQTRALGELLASRGIELPQAALAGNDLLDAVAAGATAFRPYRDQSPRRGPLRWLARARAALTRHLTRTHLDPWLERSLEGQAALAGEIVRLRVALDDERRKREQLELQVQRAGLDGTGSSSGVAAPLPPPAPASEVSPENRRRS